MLIDYTPKSLSLLFYNLLSITCKSYETDEENALYESDGLILSLLTLVICRVCFLNVFQQSDPEIESKMAVFPVFLCEEYWISDRWVWGIRV